MCLARAVEADHERSGSARCKRVGEGSIATLIALPGLLISSFLMAQAPAARAPAGQAPSQAAIAQPATPQAPTDANYRLAANHILDFRVFQDPELDAVIRISGDGNAIFPLVGPVRVAGKTIGEATELLRKRYMEGYLVNPQVNLTVRSVLSQSVHDIGTGAEPGILRNSRERIYHSPSSHRYGRRLHSDCQSWQCYRKAK